MYIPGTRKECWLRFVKPMLSEIEGGWSRTTVYLYTSLRKGDIVSNIFHCIGKEPVMHHNEVGNWVESGVLQRVLGQVL